MTQSISQKGMRIRLPLLLLGTTVLAGCASFSQDGGLDKVASITRERQGIARKPSRPNRTAKMPERK